MQVVDFLNWDLWQTLTSISKVSAILLVLLSLQWLTRRMSSARRVLLGKMTLFALLALAVFALIPIDTPKMDVAVPLVLSSQIEAPLNIPNLPLLAYFSTPEQEQPSRFASVIAIIYLLGCFLLLAKLAIQLFRLHTFSKQLPRSLSTEVSHQAHQNWNEKLAQLRQQFGIRRKVGLVISNRINAPLSWGIFHPIIMVDHQTVQHHSPDEVLRHELAHIANFDWLSLIVSRVITAIYWFHPLVWMMQKQLRFQVECAADDMVITTGAKASNYAEVLVKISNTAHAPRDLTVALAAKGKSLFDRIISILDPDRQRSAVKSQHWIIAILLTMLITLILSAIQLIGEQATWPQHLFAQTQSFNGETKTLVIAELDKLGNAQFTQLAQAMRAEDFEQRRSSQDGSFKQRRAIGPLILALHDKSPQIRRLALWGLSEMHFPETAAVIAKMLTDKDAFVRAEAAGAIGDIGIANWSERLIPLLGDEDARVRLRVAHALGDLASSHVLKALKANLSDTDPKVRDELLWAIREIEG